MTQQIKTKTNDTKIILDTKWKIPDNNIPADADLKQMFVYNEYWIGKNALLLYPNASYTELPIYYEGSFVKKEKAMATHGCGVMKMAVLDNKNIITSCCKSSIFSTSV
jgi:5-methylcytosine-specific restriction enzyme subunit McrC